MNIPHEALKRMLMELMHKKEGSVNSPDASGDVDQHMAMLEDKGDEIAGPAPSLEAYKLSKQLGNEPSQTIGAEADKSSPEEMMEEKMDPGIHEKVMSALAGRGSELSKKAHAHMKLKHKK